ncbi:MAG TPA: hypothetical protein DSN98_06390 [Thermoplasmata archaeon]|jgi:hypothetical protein|nr:MAG TPA: hypothetical protein DSN98_06390 [Thermoplasmata archaeon]
MWLITSFITAITVTALWIFTPKKYQLGFLGLMLWGLSIMVLVDHIIGYTGGPFIEMETDGLITNATVLGITMLIPIFIVWEISLIHSKLKGKLTTR